MTNVTCELMWEVPNGKREAVTYGDVLSPWGLKKFGPKP